MFMWVCNKFHVWSLSFTENLPFTEANGLCQSFVVCQTCRLFGCIRSLLCCPFARWRQSFINPQYWGRGVGNDVTPRLWSFFVNELVYTSGIKQLETFLFLLWRLQLIWKQPKFGIIQAKPSNIFPPSSNRFYCPINLNDSCWLFLASSCHSFFFLLLTSLEYGKHLDSVEWLLFSVLKHNFSLPPMC